MAFRKRRLWWLLVPVLAVLLPAGMQSCMYLRQRSAVERIEELGGRVVTTHGDPDWIRWVTGGRSFRIFERATVVNLSDTDLHDADLLVLSRLTGLERLNLSRTNVTDDGLQHLASLTGLKALDLSGTLITGRGLEQLRGLTNLEYLYLARTNVGDADLRWLNGMSQLRSLDLGGTAVSDAGIAEIKRRLPHVDVERSKQDRAASGRRSHVDDVVD